MSDQLVLNVDGLVKPEPVQLVESDAVPSEENPGPSRFSDSKEEVASGDEEEPLIQSAECRICQDEDFIKNLETPCACSGSLKYAHRKCVQHWCNEKGNVNCEICHQPYQPGYTALPRPQTEETAIDNRGGVWTISGTPLDLRDPRLLAIAEAEQQFLETEYDEYAASNASGAAYLPFGCTTGSQGNVLMKLIWRKDFTELMALLLLHHALDVPDADSEEDVATVFSEAAAAAAATQVAFVLQSGQHGGMHFTIASGTTVTPQQSSPIRNGGESSSFSNSLEPVLLIKRFSGFRFMIQSFDRRWDTTSEVVPPGAAENPSGFTDKSMQMICEAVRTQPGSITMLVSHFGIQARLSGDGLIGTKTVEAACLAVAASSTLLPFCLPWV
ncbi:hypothetical protein V6N11_049639 [Hibiscus sabdariffa]|uniref:RING-CH-type domain-containing protein n=1 Tax=Hibiscus sabdariffa TaxID=183260 RepID=A0ABR1ZUI4_9ROSI